MFSLETCEGSSSATSSPASAGGATPCGSPAGPTSVIAGQALVRASRGAWQERALAPTIRATFGRRGFGSGPSAALASSLVSRLRVRLAGRGSTAFRLTWKELVTPSGRLIFQLRASVLHKGANGSGSWQTPTTRDGKGESGKGNRIKRARNGKLHVANLCDQLVDIGRRDLVTSPAFRCSLMGYPIQWEAARVTATRSFRRLPQKSSRRTSM